MPEYKKADGEPAKLFHQIWKEHHKDLTEAHIDLLFREGKWKPFGETKKVPDYIAPIANVDFCIVLNHDLWNKLNHEQKEALLDHLLSYCESVDDKNGKRRFRKVKPNVEEFAGVIRRHGCWTADLATLGDAFNSSKKK